MTGQLSAFAGLGALRHLDLDFIGVGQIVTGDTEASGRHLFDGRAAQVAVFIGQETVFVFAAFAAVALAADAVHGDRECFVRFLADGAVRHRAGFETFDDSGPRFDVAERNRRTVVFKFEQPAQCVDSLIIVVDQIRKHFEPVGVVGADGFLQLSDSQRVEKVIFAVAPPLVGAADIERQVFVGSPFREGGLMACTDFPGDTVEADSANARCRAGKVGVDYAAVQADGFKNLCAAIAVQCGDAHLRHDFEQALVDGFDKVLLRGFPIETGQQLLLNHVVHDLADHVRIDRAGTVADQQSKVVHFARLAGFNNQSATGTLKFFDQMMVHGGGCEQGGNRRIFLIGFPVGKNQQCVAFFNSRRGVGTQFFERSA